MNARTLLELLELRHSKDVFVPECKTGPSQMGANRCMRLDAWAMKSSWSNPATYGYEIKVSRSDFLKDDKWHLYLPYCSHFAFVCAPGVCEPSEIPDGCGLLLASKNGTRLFTKIKPPRREVQIPEDLWRYILMWRTEVTAERRRGESDIEYWRSWLEEKEENRKIGHRVSRALMEKYNRDVERVQREMHALQREHEKSEEVREMLRRLGIESVYGWLREGTLKRKLEDYGSSIPQEVRDGIETINREATALVAVMNGEPDNG